MISRYIYIQQSEYVRGW